MRIFSIIILLGILVLVLGGALTQFSIRGEIKTYLLDQVWVTEHNSTITIDYGMLEPGTRIKISWMADPWVALVTYHTKTREPLVTTTNPISPSTAGYTVIISGGGDWSPVLYTINMTDIYTTQIFLPDSGLLASRGWNMQDPNLIKWLENRREWISFFKVEVTPPIEYPYTMTGLGLAIGGVVLTIAGIFIGRKKQTSPKT
jgi:hypothetical protein